MMEQLGEEINRQTIENIYKIDHMTVKEIIFVYELSQPKALEWHGRYHSHGMNEYEIHYFVQGKGSFRFKNAILTVGAGSVVLCKPQEEHAIHSSDPDDPLSYYAVLLDTTNDEGELVHLLEHTLTVHPPLRIGTNYRFFFEELKEKTESGNLFLAKSAVYQLMSFLYVMVGSLDRFHYGKSTNIHIEKALRIMQNNVFADLNIKDLAKRLELSQSYFIRLFTRKMRTSPKQYMLKLKIEAGAAMLISTSRPLYEIADILHFSSEFHFSKAFKGGTGLSPRDYRRQYMQLTPDTM